MVKHVESADEFNALKKASKPVRNPFSLFVLFSLRRRLLLLVVSFLGVARGYTRALRRERPFFEIGFFPNGGIFDDDR